MPAEFARIRFHRKGMGCLLKQEKSDTQNATTIVMTDRQQKSDAYMVEKYKRLVSKRLENFAQPRSQQVDGMSRFWGECSASRREL